MCDEVPNRLLHRLWTLFALITLFGVVQVALGLVFVPARPYAQLDAFLTHEQLADERKREETLDLLQRATEGQWLPWVMSGLVTMGIGGRGLYLLWRELVDMNDRKRA